MKHKITYKTVSTFDNVLTKDWDVFSSKKIYLQLSYLKSLEKTVSEVSKFLYTIYYKEKEAIGISVFQKLVLDGEKYDYTTVPCKFTTHLLKKYLKKNTDILICGNIFATGDYIYSFKDTFTSDEIFSYIESNVEVILQKDKKIKYVIFKEFWEEKDKHVLLKNHDYYPFNIDVNMVVELIETPNDLQDYFQAFKTKYRSRAKKALKNSSILKIEEFDSNQIKQNATIIKNLYQAVLKKSNFNLGTFNLETFYKLKINLEEKYRFFAYYYEGKIVGFKTLFLMNESVEASFIGIDYTWNAKLSIYQRMLLDYVKFSIDNKVNKLILGRTAETIKLCIGAKPHTMDLYIKHRNLVGNTILKKIIEYVKPTEYSFRSPFRKIE